MLFTKMPQGYKNSPVVCQRGMSLALKGLLGVKCLLYIDDVLIFGSEKAEHDENYRAVIEILGEFNLKINKQKSVYKADEVQFLRHILGLDKIKPTLQRSQGIKEFPSPDTKKKLQRFLGDYQL